MSTWKTALGTFAGLAVLLGLLFATGIVKVGKSSEDAEGEDAGDDEPGEKRLGAAEKEGKKKAASRKKKGKKKKGKRGTKKDLDSLGYIGATEIRPEDRAKVGVVKHDKDKVDASLNLFNPCAWGRKYVKAADGKILREAQLVDMDGKVLHKWETDFAKDTTRGWAIAKLDDKGDLFAVNARTGFVKLDWDSKTIWGLDGGYHHDFEFGADGNLYVLYEKKREVPHGEGTAYILDNGIAVISADGELLEEHSFADALADHEQWKPHLDRRSASKKDGGKKGDDEEDGEDADIDDKGRAMDLLHSNTVEFLPRDSKGNWKKGDIIVSLREMNMIMVLDPKTYKIKWWWGPGELDKQHDPTMMKNGHLLLFDNGMRRKYSRVIEIDPQDDNKILWTFRGTPGNPFYSSMRGLVQELPNGNILVVSSQEGRTMEVDRDLNIVWDFWGTYVLGGKLRVPIRLLRLYGKPLEAAKKKLAEAG
jgi:hypothetical protein